MTTATTTTTKIKRKSIVLKGSQPSQQTVYSTFKDWQAKQAKDTRTPEERGIRVGTAVLWRHKHNKIIVTDRATVQDVKGNKLTLQVKDVSTRTVVVHIREIVNSEDNHLNMREMNQRSYLLSVS
jgi:hypothetical protein